ncbi:unnamed protein product [Ambrosiozyma monospora]|uniref:Unnamed protein product n=1 Tax=Ambrosiozyma monospora TaxID=43982 RepID=A0ACB5T220_AMBMO|nr:unnamed protein product [Ambrosiozyma monospora]
MALAKFCGLPDPFFLVLSYVEDLENDNPKVNEVLENCLEDDNVDVRLSLDNVGVTRFIDIILLEIAALIMTMVVWVCYCRGFV